MSRVLVVGDVMVDEFIHGEITRMSPEAPVPIFVEKMRVTSPGGAGNVARGIHALGRSYAVVGLVGDDQDGAYLKQMIGGVVNDETYHRRTTKKTRYIVDGHHVLRVDVEDPSDISQFAEKMLWDMISSHLQFDGHLRVDVVVLSDYAKGVLTSSLCQSVIQTANVRNRRVIVDPKRVDWSRYRGAWLITPNEKEMNEALVHDGQGCTVRKMMDRYYVKNCLVTMGDRGMELYAEDGSVSKIHATMHQVTDVTGAGDTVVAVVAALVSSGTPLERAVRVANAAAGLAVRQRGTYAVTKTELLRLQNELGYDSETVTIV